MKHPTERPGKFAFAVLGENEKKLPFHLIGAGIDFRQDLDPHSRPYGYPHYQWIQVSGGRGHLELDGTAYIVGPGEGILIFPEVPHSYRAVEEPWTVEWFTFSGYHIGELLKLFGIESSGVYSIAGGDILKSFIVRAYQLITSDAQLRSYEGSALVYDFLIALMKYISGTEPDTEGGRHVRLSPVFEYIERNFSRVLSIAELSAIIGVSPQHLCTLFRRTIHQRPFEYLNTVRVHKSKQILLKQPGLTVREVARLAGYESASYFCSVFRRIEGVSPGKYREFHGQPAATEETE